MAQRRRDFTPSWSFGDEPAQSNNNNISIRDRNSSTPTNSSSTTASLSPNPYTMEGSLTNRRHLVVSEDFLSGETPTNRNNTNANNNNNNSSSSSTRQDARNSNAPQPSQTASNPNPITRDDIHKKKPSGRKPITQTGLNFAIEQRNLRSSSNQ